MKKLLALVLALVMSMSLVTISNAAFSDADKIDHTEAVDVMNALGVINGMPDGSFTPAGNVTRAEMAKMITLILLGDVDASAFIGTTTDLTDINGHWAEGFIKYCYSQGVIAGNGNGTFAPNANVTASEAAKMLLVAIGYDADIQQYVGADWKINVARDAQTKRFYADLKGLTADKTLTRDEAAQMIYNAVQADGVKVTKGWNSENNTITYRYEDAPSLLKTTFNAKTIEKVQLTKIEKVTAGEDAGTYTLTAGGSTYTKVKSDYSALLGQNVNIMYYDKDKNNAYTAGEAIFGVYPSYTNAATELIAQSSIKKSSDTKIKANGVVYELDYTAGNIATLNVAVDGSFTSGTATAATLAGNDSSYAVVRLVDTDTDGKYEYAVIYAADAQKVTYTDSAKVIAGAKTYKFSDCTIASGIAKDDYVAISYNLTDCATELAKIEKLSGKVTAIDGSKYQLNGSYVYSGTAMTIDSEYNYYVLNGVVVKFEQTTSADMSNLVFVSAVDSGTVSKSARVYFVDGTAQVVTVDQTSTGYEVPVAGGLYTVTKNDYGYKFKAISSYTNYTTKDKVYTSYTYTAGAAGDVANNANKVSTIASKQIADDAVIFVYCDDLGTAKVITGEQLKSLKAASGTNANEVATQSLGSFFKKVNGIDKITVAGVAYNAANWTGFAAASAANGYAIVVSDPITVTDGNAQYKIFNGSETVTVTDKTNTTLSNIKKFSVVAYSSIDNDGFIKDATIAKFAGAKAEDGAAGIGAASLTGYEKDTNGYYKLYVKGVAAETFTTDSKTVYLYMNSAASESDDIGVAAATTQPNSLTLADEIYGQYCQNVIIYSAATGVARVVIFDATNRLDVKAAASVGVTNLNNFTVTDANGDAVTTSSKLKAGDLLTVKNNSGSSISLSNVAGVKTLANATANGTYANGSTTILVVTGNSDVNLA